MNKGAPAKPLNNPKAPAVAPALTASTTTEAPQDPIAAMMAAAEAKQAGTAAPVSADLATEPADAIADVDADTIDAELAGLEDDNLNVVEPCDEIEEVVAVPVSSDVEQDPAAPGLFASLRAQRPSKKKAAATKVAAPTLTPAKHAALEEETAPEEESRGGNGQDRWTNPVGGRATGSDGRRRSAGSGCELMMVRTTPKRHRGISSPVSRPNATQ